MGKGKVIVLLAYAVAVGALGAQGVYNQTSPCIALARSAQSVQTLSGIFFILFFISGLAVFLAFHFMYAGARASNDPKQGLYRMLRYAGLALVILGLIFLMLVLFYPGIAIGSNPACIGGV